MSGAAPELILSLGKCSAAALLHSQCLVSEDTPDTLQSLLHCLLHPNKDIGDQETVDWCRWLVAGGRSPDELEDLMKEYDGSTMCGYVWNVGYIAYRCNTCRVRSLCMAICQHCFRRADHQGHDYNMFKSQSGGACDCGDISVMKETGFCSRHGQANRQRITKLGPVPEELLCMPKKILPKLIVRLLQYLRDKSIPTFTATLEELEQYAETIKQAESFLDLLQDYCNMGSAMYDLIIQCLIDPDQYRKFTEVNDDTEHPDFMLRSYEKYLRAFDSLPSPDSISHLDDFPSLTAALSHQTLLDELVFWIVKYEFPKKLVSFLLRMMPDPHYKEAFTRAFLHHYSMMSVMLAKSQNCDLLANGMVFVTVQVFSIERLTAIMTKELHLLPTMVVSLLNMMSNILCPNTLGHPQTNSHKVVDCTHRLMEDHCYWPLVSDFNNVLSHPTAAIQLMCDEKLLSLWFNFVSIFQGMNVNLRELESHLEREPTTYVASFSVELEAVACPMWDLVSHLKTANNPQLTLNVIKHCLSAVKAWFTAIGFTRPEQLERLKVSFHIPLHRYFTVFLGQAVTMQGFTLEELLPDKKTLHLIMMHPLRVQAAFYEILCGMWVRNGVQIKGQYMTYLQSHFCKSMVDADIFLLQMLASHLEPAIYLTNILDRFNAAPFLSLAEDRSQEMSSGENEKPEVPIIESTLIFLISILTLRTNLGLLEEDLTRLELVTILSVGDRKHSTLSELMPEKFGSSVFTESFESILMDVAQYKEPTFEIGGNLQQGKYVPREKVWQTIYDPIYVLLRAVNRSDFQNSLDRFNKYVQQEGLAHIGGGTNSLWPPWRLPSPCQLQFKDPRLILQSRFAHGLIFNLLYNLVEGVWSSEIITSLTVFLLELTVTYSIQYSCHDVSTDHSSKVCNPVDSRYDTWFPTDCLSANLRHIITIISTNPSTDLQYFDMEVDQFFDDSDNYSETILLNMETPTSKPTVDYSSESNLISLTTLCPENNPLNGPDSFSMDSMTPLVSNPALEINQHILPICEEGVPSMESNDSGKENSNQELDGELAAESSHKHHSVVNIKPSSIISLMIQLHSKLSKKADSYRPLSERITDPKLGDTCTERYRESRIGDGCFFIEKVLDKICDLDEKCHQFVKITRAQLRPVGHISDTDTEEKQQREALELKKRRAKEARDKIMQGIVAKQKDFMTTTDVSLIEEEKAKPSGYDNNGEYDCVHCHQTQPSTLDQPMGLVVQLQATSVLGHKHKSRTRTVLPLNEEEFAALSVDDSLASEYKAKSEELSRNFEPVSQMTAMNIGWQGGVSVQSCGHYVHLNCHYSYIESLQGPRSRSKSTNLAVAKGEFMCPMCRQLSNSVLPILPDVESHILHDPSDCAITIGHGISSLLMDVLVPSSMTTQSQFSMAMSLIMELITKCAYSNYRQINSSQPNHAVLQFVSSVARTNLELDLVTRGGTLTTHTAEVVTWPHPPNITKLGTCFLPLMHVLATYVKIVSLKSLIGDWCQVSGLWQDDIDKARLVRNTDVPMLLRDPVTLLLFFILNLPVEIDKAFFFTTVRQVYNLCWMQACLRIASSLPVQHRVQLRDKFQLELVSVGNGPMEVRTLTDGLGVIVASLESCGIFNDVNCPHPSSPHLIQSDGTLIELEERVQTYCLPYLRNAALLTYYIYKEPLPNILETHSEFSQLAHYLGMVEHRTSERVTSAPCLGWLVCSADLTSSWCRQLSVFVGRSLMSARKLVLTNNIWKQPQLLRLPHNYDAIFQFYRERMCGVCDKIPGDPSLCLVCGVMVCMREACCRQPSPSSVHEGVRHSVECGAGTALFLAVNSSTVVVIRGKRACNWGSVYLDTFGEEDRELKRGKPLFLNTERYMLLETQWIQHKFDHLTRKWVWHQGQL